MKRIVLLTIAALFATSAFGQMAGGVSKTYKNSKSSAEYSRGYKGFVEIGGSVGSYHNRSQGHSKSYSHNSGLESYDYNSDFSGFTGTGGLYTTHGYQFSSIFFAGAGIGAEYSGHKGSAERLILPIFGEIRCNFLNPKRHKYTPFIGLRVGANVLKKSYNGFFGNIFLGYRFPLYKQLALNLTVGYQLHKYKVPGSYYSSYWSSFYNTLEWTSVTWTNHYTDHTCSIHVGLEF